MGLPDLFLASALASFVAGAIAGLATWKRPSAARIVSFAFAVLGSLLLAGAGGLALARPTAAAWNLPLLTLFPCTVRLDPLSAWFTIALALLALAASVYSFGYLRAMERTRNLGALGFFYNVLLLSLTLVFTAAQRVLLPGGLGSDGALGLLPGEFRAREGRHAARGHRVPDHVARRHRPAADRLPDAGAPRGQPGFRRLSPAGLHASARRAGRGVPPVLPRIRREGGHYPAACLAAGRPTRWRPATSPR